MRAVLALLLKGAGYSYEHHVCCSRRLAPTN